MSTTCSAPQQTETPPRQCLTWCGLVLKSQLAVVVASILVTGPRPAPPSTTLAQDGPRAASKVPLPHGAPRSAGGGSAPTQSPVRSRPALPRSQSVCRARPPSALPPPRAPPGVPGTASDSTFPAARVSFPRRRGGQRQPGAQQHLGGRRGSPVGAGAGLSCPSSLPGRVSSLRRPSPLRPRLWFLSEAGGAGSRHPTSGSQEQRFP